MKLEAIFKLGFSSIFHYRKFQNSEYSIPHYRDKNKIKFDFNNVKFIQKNFDLTIETFIWYW